jgi:hypothetical protein
MPTPPINKASYYRQLAQQTRTFALQISMKPARDELLKSARQLEILAEEEERRTGESALPISRTSCAS